MCVWIKFNPTHLVLKINIEPKTFVLQRFC